MSSAAPSTALVLCLGSRLVGDDTVGWVVFERLRQLEWPSGCRCEFLGLGGIDIMDRLEGQELLLVVDAVRFGAAPGTVHCLNWEEIPQTPGVAVSAHSIGIREVLGMTAALWPQRMPRTTLLVGVEAVELTFLGAPLTPHVQAAVEEVVGLISARVGLVEAVVR